MNQMKTLVFEKKEKRGKKDTKNSITNPVDINKSPVIDTSLFEENRLYRPMAGRVYKMFPVETIRGCPFTCKFCNSPDQMRLYKELGHNFYRKRLLKPKIGRGYHERQVGQMACDALL